MKATDESSPTIANTDWKVTLSVGREPGTWMPKDWAGSGARLSLPMTLSFLDEEVKADEGFSNSKIVNAAFLALVTIQSGFELENLLPAMGGPDGDILGVVINAGFILFGITSLYRQSEEGFQGESALDVRAGVRRLECSGGSFVGAQGEVKVPVSGGAWTAASTGQYGQRVLRFYLDFPEEVTRNDVSIPAGRVFFSSACWDSDGSEGGAERKEAQQKLDAVQGKLDVITAELKALKEESGPSVGKTAALGKDAQKLLEELQFYRGVLPDDGFCVEGQKGAFVVKDGGLTIKRNDWRNGFGALGEVFLILGRFNLAPIAEQPQ